LSVLKKYHRSFYDRYHDVDSLNFKEFKEFCETFLKSLRVKVLIQGNLIESRAFYISQLILTNLEINGENLQVFENTSSILRIPIGSSYLKINSPRRNDKNCIIKNYYQVGKATIHAECMTEFLVNILNEPLFDTLRSHEQLGYGVACTFRKNCGTLGLIITVEYQENKNSADIIDEKIEDFLRKFYCVLKSLSSDEFSSVKRSIVSLKLIADNELEKEVNRNWNEIRSGENLFDRSELEAFEVDKLMKDEVVDFYIRVFLSHTETRKISVQVTGDGSTLNQKSNMHQNKLENIVTDVISFKEKLEIM
jgi:secreted Zn-dependent insulinase-like peptidase